jgi:hypothetical protein
LENKPIKIVRIEALIKFNRDDSGENVQRFPILKPELYILRYLFFSKVSDSEKHT